MIGTENKKLFSGLGLLKRLRNSPLSATLDHLSELVSSTPDVAAKTLDSNGVVRQWNSACRRLYGYSAAQVIGKRFQDLIDLDHQTEKFEAALHKAKNGKFPSPMQLSVKTFDKNLRFVQSTMMPVTRRGRLMHILAFDLDITERVEQRCNLQNKLSQLNTIIDTVPEGILRIDKQGMITFANRKLHRIYGLGDGQLIGTSVFDLLSHSRGQKKLRRHFELLLTGQLLPIPFEMQISTSEKQIIHTEFNWNYDRNDSGKVIGFIGTVRDITEQKNRQRNIKRSQANYKTIFNAASDAIFVHDFQTGKILDVNRQMCRMYGYSRQEALQLRVDDLMIKGPDYQHREILKWIRLATQDSSHSFEWLAKDKTGRQFWVEVNFKRANINGQDRLLAIVRDIDLRRKNRMRQRLTESVLHCLNLKSQLSEITTNVVGIIREIAKFDHVSIDLRGEVNCHGAVADVTDQTATDLFSNKQTAVALQNSPLVGSLSELIHERRTDSSLDCFTKNGSFWTNSIYEIIHSDKLRQLTLDFDQTDPACRFESFALIPLYSNNRILGILKIAAVSPNCFSSQLVRFYESIAGSIAMAISRTLAEQQIKSIARFPHEDPWPVLRITGSGIIAYSNPAGMMLLRQWGIRLGQIVSPQWQKVVDNALRSDKTETIEFEFRQKVFTFIFRPVPEAGCVNVYGFDITARKKIEKELYELNVQLEKRVADRTAKLTEMQKKLLQRLEERKQLEREIISISERERRLIGQELHDSIGQQLVGVSLMTKVLQQRLESQPEEADSAAKIVRLLSQIMNETRGLAKGFHPIEIETADLPSMLQELSLNFMQLFNVNCYMHCATNIKVTDSNTKSHLYRIAQETMTNAVKHGKAKNIWIKLQSRKNNILLRIENDGITFDPEKAKQAGMGLRLMEHRAELIESTFNIKPRRQSGAVVSCLIPHSILQPATDKEQ